MSEVTKLNSLVALSQMYGVEPEAVKKAEEEGKLEELHQKYVDTHHIFTEAEKLQFEKNIEVEVAKGWLDGQNQIPQDIYNRVKGMAYEKTERQLKQKYDFDGEYEKLDDLIENIITSNAKQPSESKKEDLEELKKLKNQLEAMSGVSQTNMEFKEQILKHDEAMASALQEQKTKYDNYIINRIKQSEINTIPFADGDNEYTKTLMQKGFENDLNNKVEFSINEEMKWIATDKQTKTIFKDKVGNPLTPQEVIKKLVIDLKIPLKQLKAGSGITSTTDDDVIKTEADFNKYCAENNIVSVQEQLEARKKFSVK